MKPKDLSYPFSWEERRVLIHDRVWFVPGFYNDYEQFSFPGWEDPALFGNTKPVYVEYCSGNGTWIAEKALREPDINWVAVEKRFDRARKIWSKIKNSKLDNLIVICGEGLLTTQLFFPKNTISHAFVNFPDPWPKAKHAKYRLVGDAFANEVSRVLTEEGKILLVTDDPTYSGTMIETFLREDFSSLYQPPYFSTELDGYGASFFDQLWRSKGRTIHYHCFQKCQIRQ